MGLKKTPPILLEDYLVLRLGVERSRIKVDVLRSRSPPESFTVPSAIGKMNFSPFIGVNTSFALSLFYIDFRCVHLFQFLHVCNQYVSFPDSHPRATHIQGTYLARL